MSKAFTREDDSEPVRPQPRRAPPALPAGIPNLITPAGARHFRDELDGLLKTARPDSAAPDEAGAQRVADIRQLLQSVVEAPAPASGGPVQFGHTVVARERDGEKIRYRLVGVEETDLHPDNISWISPIARALMNAKVGDRVRFKTPAGAREVLIEKIV